MELWWNSLDLYLKIMWGIAIPFSLIFVIQMIMTFVGMGDQGDVTGGTDVSADANTDTGSNMPVQFFTFRNLVNFFLGFSWAGISFYNSIDSKIWLTLICVTTGFILVAILMALLYALSKTTQSGNIDIKDAVGRPATVYFTIPAAGKGMGKIQMSIQQAVREYDAVSESDEPLHTGSMVRVKSVIDAHTLLVENL